MRPALILAFIALLLPRVIFAQSYTVCNNTGVTADYASLQQAINSVPVGSTLYVFPSTADYGNITLSKRLYIIGTGFMLDQNSAPYSSPNKSGVTLTSVTFSPGSDLSYLEGLQVIGHTSPPNNNRISLNGVSNITINRCMVDALGYYEIATTNTINCTISQCYIFLNSLAAPIDYYGLYSDLGSQNFLFTNNIIDDRYGFYHVTINNGTTFSASVSTASVAFVNNTFIAQLWNSNFGNFTYTNNIFVNSNPGTAYTASSVYMGGQTFNNIVTDSLLFSAGTHNIIKANIDSIFTGTTFGYHSWDQKWQVLPGSFANTYANNGGEAGAYGGSMPYVLSGIPNMPAVYGVSITPDSTIRGNVLVHIKAKASY